MSGWLGATVFCGGLVAAGWWWAVVLPGARPSHIVRASLAYLVGAALVTLGMMLVALIGLPITRLTLAGCFLGSALTGWLAQSRRRPLSPRAMIQNGGRGPALALLAVAGLALVLGVAQAVLLGPVDHIDFIRAWGLKGMEVFANQSLSFPHVSRNWRFYPLEIPNVFAALYIVLGRVDETVIRLPLALYGCSMAAAMWWMVRLVLPPAPTALAVALAVTTPEFVTSMGNGLADSAVAAYITVAAVAAYLWLEDDSGTAWAALSGFAAGAAAWTKLEGAVTAVAILAGVMLVKRSIKPPGAVTWVGWFAVFLLPWEVYQRLHSIEVSRAHFRKFFPDIPWIAEHVTTTLLGVTQWGIFWPLCIVTIAATAPWWWKTRWRGLAAVTLPNLFVTAAAYIFHYRAGSAISVEATAHRLYLHLAPSIAVMTAAATHVVWCRARPPTPRTNPIKHSSGEVSE